MAVHKTHYSADSHANLALQELRNAALDLPDASKILDRLVWSFFRDTGPNYVSEEEGWTDAMSRFLTWAIFAFRADGKSLADRALMQLSETRSSEELEVHRRIWNVTRGTLLVDGGIRRGSDIVRAIAMGASGVLLGRPVLWSLAIGGADAVSATLGLLRAEFDSAMALCGCRSVDEITPDLLSPA